MPMITHLVALYVLVRPQPNTARTLAGDMAVSRIPAIADVRRFRSARWQIVAEET
jgi:hypothetical protein